MKRVDVAIAIVYRSGQVLICLRRTKDRLGGYWEFPGGKVEGEESIGHALARELREELDIQAETVLAMPVIEHDYPDIHVRLHPFICAHRSGEPRAIACEQLKWVEPKDLKEYQFPPANAPLIDSLIQHLVPGASRRSPPRQA